MQDIFKDTHKRVSALDAAKRYGLTIDRQGRALCPFHNDTRPSMTFKGVYFHCWACEAHGDSIDFVSQLYGLSKLDAVRRLNQDFSLGLDLDKPLTPQERIVVRQAAQQQALKEARHAFEDWKLSTIKQLDAVFRLAHLARQKTEPLTPAEIEAINWQGWAERMSDRLAAGKMQDIILIFRNRRMVTNRCSTILGNSQTK